MTPTHTTADGDAWRDLRYRPREDVTVTDLGDQVVLLDPRTQEMYALDAIGRFIWRQLPHEPLGPLSDRVADRYGVDAETAATDLHELIEQLRGAGLLRPVETEPDG